jgi:sporulation integral membrane protein YtvI
MTAYMRRDEERIRRQRNFLIGAAYWAVWIIPIIIVLKMAGSVLLPVAAALIIALALKRPIDHIAIKTKINRSTVAIAAVLLLYLGTAFIIYLGVRLMLATSIADKLQWAISEISAALDNTFDRIAEMAGTEEIDRHLESLGDEFSSLMIARLSVAAASLPGVFVKAMITVIATILMEVEIESITAFACRVIPERTLRIIKSGSAAVAAMLKGCAGAYAILFGMTYAELSAGLLLMRVEGAPAIALAIAILDILPVLGTGTVLLPWGVVAFATGRVGLGMGVIALYLIISIVRNIVEPKLVGRQIGLSPAVTLPCMLVGLKLMGFAGMIALPLAVSLIINISNTNQ